MCVYLTDFIERSITLINWKILKRYYLTQFPKVILNKQQLGVNHYYT